MNTLTTKDIQKGLDVVHSSIVTSVKHDTAVLINSDGVIPITNMQVNVMTASNVF
jgi:hypothetical protein